MKLPLHVLIFNLIAFTHACNASQPDPHQTFCLINNTDEEVAIGLVVSGIRSIQYEILKKGEHMHGETVPPSIIYFTSNLKRAKYKFAQVKKGSHKYNDIHQVTLPEGEYRYYLQLKNEEIVPQVTTWLNWLMCRNVNEDGWPLHGNTHLAYMKLHKDYFN